MKQKKHHNKKGKEDSMRKPNKILLISSLLFIFSGITGVSAAEITVNEITGNPGDAVVASITVSPDSGFGAGEFVANFDPAKLEYTGYTMGAALTDHEKSSGGLLDVNKNGAAEGKIVIDYISTEDVKEGGSLLNLKFKIKEAGGANVTVEVPQFVNNDGKQIDVTIAQAAAQPENGKDPSSGADSSGTDNQTTTQTPENQIKKGENTALLHVEAFQGLDETKPITWTTSDPKLATVDATGTLTATGNGKVTITATQGDKTVAYEMDIVGEAQKGADSKGNANTLIIILSILGTIALGALIVLYIKKKKNKTID